MPMSWLTTASSYAKDPWREQPSKQAPPDLEAAIREGAKKLTNWINNIFGAPKKEPETTGGSQFPKIQWRWTSIAGVLGLLWLIGGFFVVDPAERGVITRFGRYVCTVSPGLHWVPLLIESRTVVNEEKISNYLYEAQMLTKDANIVAVTLAVQYRIDDARDYLFHVVNPESSLKQATASALRQVVGNSTLDQILTSGREDVRKQVRDILIQTLQRYHAGLLITDVALQNAAPPEAVREAFDDAIKAQEDEKRFQNQAQAYANQVEPIAQGQAQRLLADAHAYQEQIVFKAKGDTAGYLALLPAYIQAPAITRERMYIDTIEGLLNTVTKVVIDTQGNNNVFYLPLDKILEKRKNLGPVISPTNTAIETAKETPAAATTPATQEGYGKTGPGY